MLLFWHVLFLEGNSEEKKKRNKRKVKILSFAQRIHIEEFKGEGKKRREKNQKIINPRQGQEERISKNVGELLENEAIN